MTSVKLPKDYGFSSDHDLLRKTARRLLADKCPVTEVRRLVDDARGFDPALWSEIAELGWVGLVLPDAVGGAELDFLSLALLFEETGRALLPAPLLASVLAAIALERGGSAGQVASSCPAIASGDAIATVALTEPGGSWDPASVTATARVDGDGYILDGVKTHVMWGDQAALVVAPFRLDDQISLFAVGLPAAGVAIANEIGVDSTRRAAKLTFDGAWVAGSARLERGDLAAWRDTFVRGYVLLAAEMVGAAQAIFNRTREYAMERVQFKRPIGSFQAVKHPLVNVMIAIEQSRSLVVAAAATLELAPDEAEVPARMAKASATDTLAFAVDRGVQFHGGYGFTWDCDAHFFFKRSLWSGATLGDAAHHRRALAASLIDD